MFHKATKLLAKELDPDGDLIPVRCLLDQNHFRPLCLVQKKCRNSWWQKCRYNKTDYKLCDVLLPGEPAPQPDIYDSDSFTIVDHVDGKLEGAATAVTNLTTLELKSSASMSHASSVKVKKRHIGTQVLDSLYGKSKINLDHPLIKQSEKFQRDLYIVTETVETVEEAEFRVSSKTEGSMLVELPLKTKFTGLRDSKKAVIVPKACALAFRVKELLISVQPMAFSMDDIKWIKKEEGGGEGERGGEEVEIEVVDLEDDDEEGGGGEKGEEVEIEAVDSEDDDEEEGGEEEDEGSKRKYQLMEMKQECAPLLSLSTDQCGKFLNGFLAIIRNNDLLQELELQLEQALDGINPVKLKTSRPELQELVDSLQDSTGAIHPDVAESVLYFLQALDELSEYELLLLEESVERKILPKQTALVQCILEEVVSNEEGKLIIETQKVSPFIKDELDITEAMIKLCGVTVQRSGASLLVTGNPDTFLALSTLYVALYVLKILSE